MISQRALFAIACTMQAKRGKESEEKVYTKDLCEKQDDLGVVIMSVIVKLIK